MITRRNFNSFFAATLGCGCCGIPAVNAESLLTRRVGPPGDLDKSVGCMVNAKDYENGDLTSLGAGRVSSFVAGGQSYRVGASSGNSLFDRALAETLYQISKVYGVTPTFGFIMGGNVANAFATPTLYKPESGDAELPARNDGTVLFGDGILQHMTKLGSSNPIASVLAVCAHEFAHIAQYNYAYNETLLIQLLTENQSTVKQAELHADYLAGYYVGTAKRRNPATPSASVAVAAQALGDFQTEDKAHHGTPQKRGQAVYSGFQVAVEQNQSFEQAVVSGLKHVQVI